MPLDMPLECALRICREFAGVTVQEVAAACDVPWLHVKQFEFGSRCLRPAQLIALATVIREAVELKVTRDKEAREKKRARGLAQAKATRQRLAARAKRESFRVKSRAQLGAWERRKARQVSNAPGSAAPAPPDAQAGVGAGFTPVEVPSDPAALETA